MNTSLKNVSGLIGTLLATACMGFVAWRLLSLAPQVGQLAQWPQVIVTIALSTLVYATGCLSQALAWWLLLRIFAGPGISLRSAATGHMRAQVAKYLPGNVFHFAARHVYALAAGLGHAGVATAAVAETVIMVGVAAVLSVAVPTQSLPVGLAWITAWRWLLVAGLIACILIGVYFWKQNGARENADTRSWAAGCGRFLMVASSYIALFLVSSIAFWIALDSNAPPPGTLVPIVAICWLGGFLVIGAPGGLGVREALFLALLGPTTGEAQAVLAALVFRAATILGDCLLTLVGYWIGRRTAQTL